MHVPLQKENIRENIIAIVLAAGSSSRLGQSKQLIKINNTSLLARTVATAVEGRFNNVIVVLGHNHLAHQAAINHLPVEIVVNEKWQQGMGSSLKAGLTHALKNKPNTSALLVMVCDQPYLSAAHLNTLTETYLATQPTIVTSFYNNTHGVPALFDNSVFSELLQIEDGQGAKSLFHTHESQLIAVEWQEGNVDIDTPEDLKHLPTE